MSSTPYTPVGREPAGTSSCTTRDTSSAILNTWGWFLVAFGVLQFFAAFAIWRGTPWARWFGVARASANTILQTLWIPAVSGLAMTILTHDIVAIYGLLAYAGRRRAALEARARAAR